MKKVGGKFQTHHIVMSIVVVLLVASAMVAFLWYFSPKAASPQHEQATSTTTAKAPTPVSIKANTLFFGDTFWGRFMNQWSMASSLKTAYPFSRLSEFKRDSYDAWIGNLECPTVAGFTQTPAQEDATLSFNCSPDYLPEAAKWFTAMSLANNHTDNRGAAGFTETKQQLDKVGIQYFGGPDPSVVSDACEVVALPITVTYSDASTKHQKLPIALCGYNGVFKIPPASSIAEMKKYAAMMPVIVMPHMGTEYQSTADALRTSVYHSMIDAGADVVLGNHPHWVQPTEAYKGKLIVYSMGNFIFDQQANKEVTRSAMINIVMTTSNSASDQLAAWLKLGDTCASYKDTCLQQATNEKLQKLPIEFKFGVVGSNSANKITKPATAAEMPDLLQRLQWSQTMSQLQPPQSTL
jgi:poly-gamma-glutamate synthesis protein (capsule biosynthesis protein)